MPLLLVSDVSFARGREAVEIPLHQVIVRPGLHAGHGDVFAAIKAVNHRGVAVQPR